MIQISCGSACGDFTFPLRRLIGEIYSSPLNGGTQKSNGIPW